MTYQSPALELDVLQSARDRGVALFRVVCRRQDGAYGRLAHYTHAVRQYARQMASDLARAETARGAIVEEIDLVSGRVVEAFKPEEPE